MPASKPTSPRSSIELARASASAVALAARQRSGAGRHGKQGRDAHRAERRATRAQLRRGDYGASA